MQSTTALLGLVPSPVVANTILTDNNKAKKGEFNTLEKDKDG